jgi:hypothetical protein
MNQPMTRTLGVAAAAAAVMLWPHLGVRAFNPQPDPPAFGLMGLDPFAVARLNAVCANTPLPGGVNPGPCDVTLAFDDSSGRLLKQMRISLEPGHGASFDLTAREAMTTSARRVEVQPSIFPSGRGFVLVTAEIYDEFTGRTMALLNPTEPKSLGATAGQ